MPSILVVDDESVVRNVVSTLLKQAGYDVTIAEYGLTGYSLAQTGQPDLVLLDLMMPVVDGFEVLRRLKDDPSTRHIPVIMLTAKIDAASERECMRLGAADYIKKPWGPRELEERIGMALGYPELTRPSASPGPESAASDGAQNLESQEPGDPSESPDEKASPEKPAMPWLRRFRTERVVIPDEGETHGDLDGRSAGKPETDNPVTAETTERLPN